MTDNLLSQLKHVVFEVVNNGQCLWESLRILQSCFIMRSLLRT